MGRHRLSEFRVAHRAALDGLSTDILASLPHTGALSLDLVAQDGMCVRARATTPSFCRSTGRRSPCGRDGRRGDGGAQDPVAGHEAGALARRGLDRRRQRPRDRPARAARPSVRLERRGDLAIGHHRDDVDTLEAGGTSEDDALSELKSKMGLLAAPTGGDAKQLGSGGVAAAKADDKIDTSGMGGLTAEDLKELEDLDLSAELDKESKKA